jgi:hypothetical protein
MSVAVNWANEEKTVILLKVVGDFTAEEYINGIEKRKALQSTVDHKSSVIADLSEISRLPDNVLANLGRLAKVMPHPNWTGLIVMVGLTGDSMRFGKMFASTFFGMHFTDTVEEAFALIAELTQTVEA